MSAFESKLHDKDKRIEVLDKSVSRMEGKIDTQEQYSRRTSVRISGVDEARGGEDVERVVETIIEQCNSASISMANINRAHRVRQRNSAENQHGKPRQIIVQFKDYNSKVAVMRSRKMLRNAMPNIYINEDLTQVRSALLFKARSLKRIVVKDNRRVAWAQMEELRQHLRQLLAKDIIRPSCSSYSSPVVLVRKKSGELRMCVDYRGLNPRTVKDAYPLPRIDESLDALGGAAIFSTMDLQSAYYQVEIAEEDKAKTAFTTPIGLFSSLTAWRLVCVTRPLHTND